MRGQRIEGRERCAGSGDVAAYPFEGEVVLARAREPQGWRVGLRQDDVRINPAAALHRSPAVRLARRTPRRVALGARETEVVATRDAAVLPLDHSPARRGDVP